MLSLKSMAASVFIVKFEHVIFGWVVMKTLFDINRQNLSFLNETVVILPEFKSFL